MKLNSLVNLLESTLTLLRWWEWPLINFVEWHSLNIIYWLILKYIYVNIKNYFHIIIFYLDMLCGQRESCQEIPDLMVKSNGKAMMS